MSRFVAVALLFFAPGCGTMLNLHTVDMPANQPLFEIGHHPAPQLVYGGVRIDAQAGKGWFQESPGDPLGNLTGAYVWFVDLPLSAIADTLTLPVTVPARVKAGPAPPALPERPWYGHMIGARFMDQVSDRSAEPAPETAEQ